MTILYNRALLLAKTEVTFDTDALPNETNDAYLVIDPQFTPNIALLERPNVLPSLSHEAPITGRRIGVITFHHEVRSSGNTNGTVEPRLGRLLEACGMGVTQVNTAPETLISVESNTGGNLDKIGGFVVTTAYQQAIKRRITVQVTHVSPFRVRVFGIAEGFLPAFDTGTADITITNNTEFLVHDDTGALVVGLKIDFGTDNNLTVGDNWDLTFRPLGYYYKPISNNMPSLTMYLYYPDDQGNALLHAITGARGTWNVDATGGQYGKFQFTFTGSYVNPIDVTMPTQPIFETQKPAQVERANLSVITGFEHTLDDVTQLCASKFTIDIANSVVPRECVNAPNSFRGAIIVDRKPVLGFDPEAVLEETNPFWSQLANAISVEWKASVGTVKGNVVAFEADNVVYTAIAYANRNSIRAYDIKANLAKVQYAGNDEMEVYFS